MFRYIQTRLNKIGLLQNPVVNHAVVNNVLNNDDDDKKKSLINEKVIRFHKPIKLDISRNLYFLNSIDNKIYDRNNWVDLANHKTQDVLKYSMCLTLKDYCELILKFDATVNTYQISANFKEDNEDSINSSNSLCSSDDFTKYSDTDSDFDSLEFSESNSYLSSDSKLNNTQTHQIKGLINLKVKNLDELEDILNCKGCQAAESGNYQLAVEYWECAARMDYVPAQFNLALYYDQIHKAASELDNKEVNSEELAEKYYRKAIYTKTKLSSRLPHPEAALNLALLLNRRQLSEYRDEIKNLLSVSANQGIERAKKALHMIEQQESGT